ALQASPKKRKVSEKVTSEADTATVVSEAIPPPVPQKKKEVESTVAAVSFWDPLFNPVEFVEKHLDLVGDSSRFSAAYSDDLRRMSLGHELKGMMLNYILSVRQEHEVLEGKRKMELVDKELSSIEGRYTGVMEKLSKEIADLKSSREEEMEKLKK
ncbi:hypothetical protein A2U01_0052500, partial [Trifolium medium]|nr:hypothetical protein [Trifolium medium]